LKGREQFLLLLREMGLSSLSLWERARVRE